jgi:hypothetical protein
MKIFAILDKTKPDTGSTGDLNLAAVMFMTVQVSRLRLWHELLVSTTEPGLKEALYIVYLLYRERERESVCVCACVRACVRAWGG